ncbi:tRNA (adenosine(37)-N6)-dimethylallyltransferase MiaA [Patescibacteria group bacterium]|nr:tRNA (adenosine(37)-N6)-dimethylallyltransferase MiaA [Patescibacteria group bacterium]
MKKLLVVLGPTATGKTDAALRVAKKFNGELVACDSRQVYQGLDIGTGKLPGRKVEIKKDHGFWEMNGIRVWMYDVADLKEQYTVADYVKEANKIIEEILARGKLPIIVGGTGLYLRALLEGLPNLKIPIDEKLRSGLVSLTLEQLQQELHKLDIRKLQSLNESDKKNPRRLIRAIEMILNQNSKFKIQNYNLQFKIEDTNYLKIGLTASREIIYRRINKKAEEWVSEGIVKEVGQLIKHGVSKERIKQLGLFLWILIEYLDKEISLQQMIEKMQNKVRQYAKRQITWFKKEKNTYWFDIADADYLIRLENMVAKWYDSHTTYAAKD